VQDGGGGVAALGNNRAYRPTKGGTQVTANNYILHYITHVFKNV